MATEPDVVTPGEAAAYRRLTFWAFSGVAAVLATGAYFLGRQHQPGTDKPPPSPITVICRQEGPTP